MSSDRVEDFLAELAEANADQHALVQRLRRMVLGLDARVTEDVRYGGLLFAAGSPFCGVYAYPRHVALEFSRGAGLADTHHVLEGEGPQRRHIKLHHGDELFGKNVRSYLTEALAAATASRAARQRAKAAR